jgi:hypothetical protein
MKKNTSFDSMYTTWVFIWFIFYYIKLIKFSPKYVLIFISIYSIVSLIYMIYLKLNIYNIFYEFIFMCIAKFIPLYIIWKDLFHIEDILFGIALFVIYALWLNYKNESIIKIYTTFN